MNKIFTLLSFCCALNLTFGQLADGSKLTTNITGTDINGNAYDLFAELDAGKSAIVDVFTAWCPPCWTYHERGVLKDMYAAYGPEGTNQLSILGLEAEATNTGAQITGPEFSDGTRARTTLGDWTEGVKYPIIDDASYNTALSITAFPTLYLIRPDRTIISMPNGFRYNNDFYLAVLFNDIEKDLGLETSIAARAFCADGNERLSMPIRNFGTTLVEEAMVEFYVDGVLEESKRVTNINPLTSKRATFGRVFFDETTTLEVKIGEVDGVADTNDFLNSTGETDIVRAVTPHGLFTVAFTTDFYPGETSWELLYDGEVVAEDSYNPGNADQFGGGGADANTTFTYDVDIENIDFTCLELNITDAFGDGMTAVPASATKLPGVEVFDGNGNIVRNAYISDLSFENSNSIEFGVEAMPVNITEIETLNNLTVAPNPVRDALTLNLSFNSPTDVSVMIINHLGQAVRSLGNYYGQTNINESIDVSGFNSGVYFLTVSSKDGVSKQKFIKL